MNIAIEGRSLITLLDMNNESTIEIIDVTNATGELMDYYYYYFDGYKNYISYLLKRGAVIHVEESSDTYLQVHNTIVPIYEIPRVKVDLNSNHKGRNNDER